MNNKKRNIIIACSCAFICLLAVSAFLLFRQSVKETKEVTVQRINSAGDKIEEKIDATATAVKEDYSKAKEAAANAKEKAKTKYKEWKEKREQEKSPN